MGNIRFALALHNHQPVGNFEGVIEAAYADSYLPFIEVMERYPRIPFSLHISGCLVEWLADRRPEYVDRLRGLVRRGQLEIIGGAFYEPILPMIPSRDRIGQIRGYSEYLKDLFDTSIRGMWLAERVWEQSLTADLAKTGIEYTILDDFHFRKAGLRSEELTGYFLTEDDGQLLAVFPGSELARYMIPFQEPDRFIDYLRSIQQRGENALVVFADDGEKFGTWPETKAHVYQHGWIHRFMDALVRNLDWIELCTLSQALDDLPPAGRIYLPDCCYREMTEWVLPADRQLEYQRVWHSFDHHHDGDAVKAFLKAGYWRNYKVRYPETNEMYCRMLQVSRRLDQLCQDDGSAFSDHRIQKALQSLYRGQCNCAYWHGAFGGAYLPHLRNAIYAQLIDAENQLDAYERGDTPFALLEVADLNADRTDDVRLTSDKLVAFIDPSHGGHMYELDVRSIGINVGATINRRPEAYHEKVRHFSGNQDGQVASIHDRVVFKQPGLDRKLHYDRYPRKLLVDHFLPTDARPEQLDDGSARELGDFVTGRYRLETKHHDDAVTATLTRTGQVGGRPATVKKNITLTAGKHDLDIRYRLDNLNLEHDVLFAVEFNIAALAAGQDDRYFVVPDRATGTPRKLGRLESSHTLRDVGSIALVDEWLGIDLRLHVGRWAGVWAFPIQTVSQSEGGFELVHQCACVVLHWVIPAATRSWETEIGVVLDTAMAEARRLAPVG